MFTRNRLLREGSFFARILTSRHLLTHRHGMAKVALLAIATLSAIFLVPVVREYVADSSSDVPGGRVEQANQVSNEFARPLSVRGLRLSQAGPEFLSQKFTGIVMARRRTELSAKTLGRVERIAVDIGDRVSAGQVLIDLDRAQLQSERAVVEANLNAAQARLAELQHGPRPQELEQSAAAVKEVRSQAELLKANYDRAVQLYERSSISRQEFDESRFRATAVFAQLESAEKSFELLQVGTRSEQIDMQLAVVAGLHAQLKTIDIQLAEKHISCPYTGHIQARLVDEGQIVAAGQPLLEIVETTALEVHVGLPVDLCTNLSEDQLYVKVGDTALPTTLARVSPTVQSTTQTREVVLALKDQSYQLIPLGSAVQVELKRQMETQGYWIPTSALTSGIRGLWAVFVATPLENVQPAAESRATHRIERRQVELLRSQGDWSEVRGPIAGSEQLVIDGIHRIVAGQKVRLDAK